jgi:hypothetical protein
MPSAQFFFDLTLPDASSLLSAIVVVYFLASGLYKTYPIFFAYWVFDLLLSALPLLIADFPTLMTALAIGFIIRCFLYFLLVSELVDRVLTDHPGLGRRVVHGVMVVAAGTAIYTLRFDPAAPVSISERLQLLLQMERLVAGCLLVFLLIIVAFLWYFPVRMNRNTKAYCFGFTAFFLVKAIAPFVLSLRGLDSSDLANRIHLIGELACQAMWLFAITRSGAASTPAFPRGWTLDEQKRILGTLNSFEQQISRSRGN